MPGHLQVKTPCGSAGIGKIGFVSQQDGCPVIRYLTENAIQSNITFPDIVNAAQV